MFCFIIFYRLFCRSGDFVFQILNIHSNNGNPIPLRKRHVYFLFIQLSRSPETVRAPRGTENEALQATGSRQEKREEKVVQSEGRCQHIRAYEDSERLVRQR